MVGRGKVLFHRLLGNPIRRRAAKREPPSVKAVERAGRRLWVIVVLMTPVGLIAACGFVGVTADLAMRAEWSYGDFDYALGMFFAAGISAGLALFVPVGIGLVLRFRVAREIAIEIAWALSVMGGLAGAYGTVLAARMRSYSPEARFNMVVSFTAAIAAWWLFQRLVSFLRSDSLNAWYGAKLAQAEAARGEMNELQYVLSEKMQRVGLAAQAFGVLAAVVSPLLPLVIVPAFNGANPLAALTLCALLSVSVPGFVTGVVFVVAGSEFRRREPCSAESLATACRRSAWLLGIGLGALLVLCLIGTASSERDTAVYALGACAVTATGAAVVWLLRRGARFFRSEEAAAWCARAPAAGGAEEVR